MRRGGHEVTTTLKHDANWLLAHGWYRWFHSTWRHPKHNARRPCTYREALAIQEALEKER
jgi:hypothetical protein